MVLLETSKNKSIYLLAAPKRSVDCSSSTSLNDRVRHGRDNLASIGRCPELLPIMEYTSTLSKKQTPINQSTNTQKFINILESYLVARASETYM